MAKAAAALAVCAYVAGAAGSPNGTRQLTELTNSDFNHGTYMITRPGVYKLVESITFEPQTPRHFPPTDSTVYTNQAGFWLGFFAAISVAANDVVIDLNGHTIAMSEKFVKIQRFFTIIELANKPFTAKTGPPQFGASELALVPGTNVVIKDGTLGLSSHMGIHGNSNSNIEIRNVTIKDFETGGIQFNSAENVVISNCTIGPSLGAPGSSGTVPGLATLSQANLLTRIAQGMQHENDEQIVALQQELDSFVAGTSSGIHFFNDPANGFADLPDGSALYGILFHKSGPAINDFAMCSHAQFLDIQGNMKGNIKIENTVIKDLHLKSDEVVKMLLNGKPVLGPAGDVVQILRLKNSDGSYTGTTLSDAQLRMAELKAAAAADGMSTEDLFANFGSTNIPQQVMSWMKGTNNYSDAIAGASWVCAGDAMSHFNKGVVGLRLEFMTDVSLDMIDIRGLKNTGTQSPHKGTECGTSDTERYLGSDVRAVSIGGGTSLAMDSANMPLGVAFDSSSCSSTSGTVNGFVDTGFDNVAGMLL